ncbi:Peptidoglycan/LPS O-acetylase OafA/YrhL, contains acyltransferase and SGNH-hydrolase domains [Sphingomonas gellani]|uniref:Peptidoglycan/LPS O-acetylase OafA/YrhL, contains acyltransferase and SGNH-hydrolase domains n=2 Tax=Sphingomonas gellani TaxID=1166340 RepID=A0A1H8II99_9SPHN|nr:acyltransferase family protein [Sphingomonas gellani]SEN67992.1 Peptidoglycan/LPS O-acetylase OafA/YrhL, contains acyltransferase and SGNH-hydrolase domains [Sphingomonas gellani]
MERHYGMDWLRIGAFGLLILYHIGMVFVPWPFHVKTAHPLAWVEIPMFATNPWRLTLLFVVSGYASRTLLAKAGSAGSFLLSRSSRLLPPLLVGMAVIVPPQTWVELTTQHGYRHGYLPFWLGDYFRFGTIDGIIMPTWNHLWFVVYLWIYSVVLACTCAALGRHSLQGWFDRAFAGWRTVVLPAIYFLLLGAVLFPQIEDTHDLFHDGVAHLRYLPAFLFGFGVARSPLVLASFARHWRVASTASVLCFATIATLLVLWPDFTFPETPVVVWTYRFARHLETWTAIAALIGIAERFWNRDGRWRATLAEATFPFYLIHQTIIVLVGGWLLPFVLGPGTEFAILLLATVAGCWALYDAGRHVGWLRPLIGLKHRPR